MLFDSNKKVPPPKARPWVPYKPQPHPMQARIDEIRKIPSLWTRSKVTAIVYGLTTTLSANTQSIGDSNEQ